MSATQRADITSPAPGLMVYQTDGQQGFWYYRNPDGWTYLSPSADNLGNHNATQNLGLNGNWISNNGANSGIRISDAGQVGIGTSTPSQMLQIVDNGTAASNVTTSMIAGTSGKSTLAMGSSVNNFLGVMQYDNVLNTMEFWTNNTPRMLLDNSGRLGLNVTLPAWNLSVNGGSASSYAHFVNNLPT